jgi:hypothetical protein
MKTRISLILLLTTAVGLGLGCQTTVLTPDEGPAATYRLGKLRSTLSAEIGNVYQAAGQAVEGLNLTVVQSAQDQLEAKVIARTAQDEKITVSMTALTSNTTKMEINAGSLARSRRIYEAILANMQGSAAPDQM